MEFSRQEYWSGLPFPSPGDLPNPGIEPVSLMSPILAGGFFTTSATWKVPELFIVFSYYSSVVFKIYSDMFCFIPEFGNLCFLFSVLLDICQFYWHFQRTSSLFQFFSLLFFWFPLNWCLLQFLSFHFFCLLWVDFALLFLASSDKN